MKKVLVNSLRLLVIGLMLQVASSSAQDVPFPTGTVCVPQATFNKMVGHLESLVEAKDAIAKLLQERGASDAAINSALKVIDGWKQVDVINGMIILKFQQVIELYEKVLAMYERVVTALEGRLNKPKSAWKQFLGGVKQVLTLLAGIALGRLKGL